MKKHIFAFLSLMTIVCLACLWYLQAHRGVSRTKTKDLPIYMMVSPFELIERSGAKVTGQALLGKVWVADFIFTRCAGQCPMMTQKMAILAKQLPNVQFVSFSVDPDYDTPAVMKEHAENCGVDWPNWWFLTGPKQEISAVTESLKMGKLSDPMMHSNHFVLVDKDGVVRGFYDANEAARMRELAEDIRKINNL